ncbi:hypothetical protein BSKO_13122 [Bryopsis sp. KO-2023]|nr:hypothetical protein BSKO_13122 [Bryopsis sp. KO-2023]
MPPQRAIATGKKDGTIDSPRDEAVESPTAQKRAKYKSFKVRFVSTIAMIGSFLFMIYLGHVPLMALILFIQWCMVRELFELARESQQDNRIPGFRAQQWYFFGAATFFFYLRFIKNNLLKEITLYAPLSRLLGWLVTSHSLISYSFYMGGLIFFVLSLKKGMYLYQFGQFAWTHMILMIVFVPSSFFISNIVQGLIWFLLPCSLIIANDITAYLAGFFFGKTPLIKLSPKKTWEGFIGGFLGTVLLSFIFTRIMAQFSWMICPRQDLSIGWLECEPDEIYLKSTYNISDVTNILPASFVEYLNFLSLYIPVDFREVFLRQTITLEPMALHAAVLAVFASVISPFGGFFASGFKRAFKVKDFAAIIPGHGGMTDRMDCQMLMAVFSYLYFFTFVQKTRMDVGSILDMAVKLDQNHQLELFGKLGNYLVGEDSLPDSIRPQLQEIIQMSCR